MKLFVGQAKLIGPISRYAGRFNFLELAAEPGRCPGSAVLRRWRQEVPEAFAFSVRLARAVGSFDASAEPALTLGLKTAEALEARWLLVQTPSTLGPGQRNADRLKRLFERLLATGRHIAWDPRGVWDEAEVLPVISEVDVQWARDASRYAMVEEPLAYARIPALGSASRVGLGLAERAGENLRGFDEVYLVIEGEGAGRAARIVRDIIAQEPPSEQEGDELEAHGVEELTMSSARSIVERTDRRRGPDASAEGDVEDEIEEESLDESGEDDESDEDFDDESDESDESDEDFDDEDDESDEDFDDEDDDEQSEEESDDGKPGESDASARERGGMVENDKPEHIDDADLPWAPNGSKKRSR